jgi:hypothetical protein
MANIVLDGTEVLQVLPVQANGLPAAATGQTTTQDIADLATGAGLTRGTFIATGAAPVTEANAAITATSVVAISLNTVGGAQGAHPTVVAIVPGVSFDVTATAADTSTYNYVIL